MVVNSVTRGPAVGRLVTVCVALAVGLGMWVSGGNAASLVSTGAVPEATCGPGSLPETSTQGRVPQADYDSGRAAQGYRCNTEQVGHQGASGGFKTLRYTDAQGHTCGFYDSSLTLPRDVLSNTLNGNGLGVMVLDMTDPANPRRTANLVSLAMLSPHESLLVNEKRGLLVAVLGTAATAPGVVDVYDVKSDCRKPRLLSSTPSGILGHESGFSPDGKTVYAAGIAGTLTAIDLTYPRLPRTIFTQFGVVYHGLRLSPDGNTMYVANVGQPGPSGVLGAGLRILDVSQIQARVPNPKVPVLSSLTWADSAIPQVAEPFTSNGHEYVFEVDEFVDLITFEGLSDLPNASTGVARIINVDDPQRPFVVSNVSLTVHQPDQREGPQAQDPMAWFPAQGYAGHYCGLPKYDNPKIAGCSMILSGLRLFDIRDVENPKEIAYFNKPVTTLNKLAPIPALGSYAMSQPAWDPARNSVWFTDTNSGFYVVKLTNGAEDLLH